MFTPGASVRLRAGGQFMTVAKIASDKITCYWLGQDGKACFGKFFPGELILLEDLSA